MAKRSPYRATTDHQAAAKAARAERGTWKLAGLYNSSPSARTVARLIGAGDAKYPAYRPAGAFEAYAAPAGDEVTVWVRYVAGDEPVKPLPDRMSVRVCDRGDGREYVGVCIVTVTISTLCPVCGGPRGWDTVRPHRFHEDGEWLVVDCWDNPCGHVDAYAAVLRESRDQQLPPPAPVVEEPPAPAEEDGPVALILAAASERRGMHAKQAAQLLDQHGYTDAAAVVMAELKNRRGHMSAKGAASLLHTLARDAAPTTATTRNDA
ncbi:hypothetical protein ABZX75_17190 [Streptomyces sp. NPDC003038]|uniref:hypothetical protein n=1 Tax=unclassified Streptomyces TaxID=2593676 RepID=UPI0033B99DE4